MQELTDSIPTVHRLPLECIELIIDYATFRDHWYHPHSLHSLLTVSKQFFYSCVERLYKDPFRAMMACRDNEKALDSLVPLVLRCSLLQDLDVEHARAVFAEKLALFPPSPFTDYLSYVRTLRHSRPFQYLFPIRNFDFLKTAEWEDPEDCMVEYKTLLWAACGDHLPTMRSIWIDETDIDRYIVHAEQMESIEEVCLVLNSDWIGPDSSQLGVWERYIQQATVLATKLMNSPSHANKDRQQRRALDVGVVLSHEFFIEDQRHLLHRFRPQLQQLFGTLPIKASATVDAFMENRDCSDYQYDRDALWLRFSILPESLGLSTLKAIRQWSPYEDAILTAPFPTQGTATILQQCRSLEMLGLGLTEQEDRNGMSNGLAWAVQERRDVGKGGGGGGGGGGNLLQPLVPLQQFDLGVDGVSSCDKLLQDALFGFGSTLQTISIFDAKKQLTLDLAVFRDLPELCALDLSHIATLVCSEVPFVGCTKLERLRLHNTTGTSDTPFPRWNLPSLQCFTLLGPFIRKFDQRSFESMTNLKSLLMGTSNCCTFSNTPIDFQWTTWPWLCSRLISLHLNGGTIASFRLPMILSSLVDVSHLALDKLELVAPHCDERPRNFFCFGDKVPRPVIPTVTSLCLRNWFLSPELLTEIIPTVFPNLRVLDLPACNIISQDLEDQLRTKFGYTLRNLSSYDEDE